MFQKASFVKTAMAYTDYPVMRSLKGKILPEVAVAGRSNAGKSSLLNVLFQNRSLVKVSSTPGKTQGLNFFTVDDCIAFVDLPGYGFAKVPQDVRKQWGPMVHGYLNKREELKLMLFLFDIRREPNEEDKQLLEWAAQAGKAVIMVLTKVDKLNRAELVTHTQKIIKAFDCDQLHYVHFSSPKGIGKNELIRMIQEAFSEET